MNPGELNERVIIQHKAVVFDDYNAPVEGWDTFAELWSKPMIGTGREFFGAKRNNAELSGIFQLRRNKALTEQMRVVFDSVTYEITAVIHLSDKQITELHVREVQQ